VKGRISILGPRGTFSEEAARRFDPEASKVFCSSIDEVFDSVEKGKAEHGIVPVENSLEGSVAATLQLLLTTPLRICAEIVIDVKHCLLALPGSRMEDIREVISHPHALAQCRGYIKSLGDVRTRNLPSTAEAAREVSVKRLRGSAAIAPRIAAELYGLTVLAEGVQDEGRNQTRFFALGRECGDGEAEKTSIILGLEDRPGALYKVLGYFARANINLTKIESRPTRKSLGDYIFYIDFEGDAREERVGAVLRKVRARATFFKVLGSYARIG